MPSAGEHDHRQLAPADERERRADERKRRADVREQQLRRRMKQPGFMTSWQSIAANTPATIAAGNGQARTMLHQGYEIEPPPGSAK